MMIRLVYNNGEMTGWRRHGRKQHKMIMQNPPEKVVIRLRDFYKDTLDYGTQIVDFEVFLVLSHESILLEKAQEKEADRHIDDRELEDDLISSEAQTLVDSAETQIIFYDFVQSVLQSCSEVQKQRFNLYMIYGYRYEEIAAMQDCSINVVHKSVQAVLKKFKKFYLMG